MLTATSFKNLYLRKIILLKILNSNNLGVTIWWLLTWVLKESLSMRKISPFFFLFQWHILVIKKKYWKDIYHYITKETIFVIKFSWLESTKLRALYIARLLNTALTSYQSFSSDQDPHENLSLKLLNVCKKKTTS